MFKYAFIAVIGVGIVAFIVKNIFFAGIVEVPQKNAIKNLEKSPKEREIFRGVFNGMDGIHNVVGSAVVLETPQGPVLRLESFSATPGPDLVVLLSVNDDVTFIKNIGSEPVSLGSLQKMSGEQTYTLPAKYQNYKSVVIWSRALSILFGAAPIK